MYAGRNYSVTSTSTEHRDFECVHCGHQRTGMVVGVGTGSGHSPLFLDNRGARDRAHDSAHGAARQNAYYAVRGAVCPRCGKTDRAVRFRVYAISATIGLLLGGVLGGAVIIATEASRTGMWLGGLACLAITIGTMFTRVAKTFTPVFWDPETPAVTAPKS
jgi:Zn ribbon nucleic-acid-binding protein